MARATQERLDRDAARFGLTPPAAAEPPPEKKYDLLRCPICRRFYSEHLTVRELKDCMRVAAERKAVQP